MTTLFLIPTRTQIESLSTGNLALNCFGSYGEVVGEVYKREDVNGKLFAHYYVKMSETSKISMSMKEDELVRHTGTSRLFNSWQLDQIEKEMLGKGERVREL